MKRRPHCPLYLWSDEIRAPEKLQERLSFSLVFAQSAKVILDFGRVYAAYGGIFVTLAMLWGWFIDGKIPDFFDIVGGGICLKGVFIIRYWPRS